ncbi:MAG: tRNA threonylcarbamoyladenosine dehydratase [Bacteroidetes bacterium GWF2_40_14]|nr:MAG: tRNA threonylcarbamoyladenosine dehydratase [Bacteroidetes bacterium GWF2_40_14]
MENWLIRSELLLGKDTLEVFKSKRVAVVGLGGVGAYAAEMLARAGIGAILIIDSDIINPSNKNRQLLALESTVGMAKTDVMARRLIDINPQIELKVINEFITEENIAELLAGERLDYIVDAIDTLSPKIALIKYALDTAVPVVSSMGAGAKLDATKIRITDISKSFNCPLAYMLRKRLRKEGISKGFKVVFSEELPDGNAILAVEEQNKKSIVGTISYLPAVFGAVCAQVVIRHFVG